MTPAEPTKKNLALRLGLAAEVEQTVPHAWTIAAYDPALPAVLSTPAMIALMEVASAKAVAPELPPHAITVGTRIEVDHLKPVPAGAVVGGGRRGVQQQGRMQRSHVAPQPLRL